MTGTLKFGIKNLYMGKISLYRIKSIIRQQLLETIYDILNIFANMSDLYMSIKSNKIGKFNPFCDHVSKLFYSDQ